jgi:hypothetical protein
MPAPTTRAAARGPTSCEDSSAARAKAALFVEATANPKLAPVDHVPARSRDRPVPVGPFVSTVATPIGLTCPNTCPFKSTAGRLNGCYAEAGFTRFMNARMEAAAGGLSVKEIVAEVVRQVDAAFDGGPIPQDGAVGGRDLRLFTVGDVGSIEGARMVAAMATRWKQRGGGRVWAFTHWWRTIPRESWGPDISVLASVELPEDIAAAMEAGYAAAIVVPEFPSAKAFALQGTSVRVIPCRYETDGITCAECGLCMDDQMLLTKNFAIGFEVHGQARNRAKQALVQICRSRDSSNALSTMTAQCGLADGDHDAEHASASRQRHEPRATRRRPRRRLLRRPNNGHGVRKHGEET